MIAIPNHKDDCTLMQTPCSCGLLEKLGLPPKPIDSKPPDTPMQKMVDDMAFACQHNNIVESRTDPDGSVLGMCLDCKEDGFPILDVGYEEYLKEREAEIAGEKAEWEALSEVEKLKRQLETSNSVKQFWERKARRHQKELQKLRGQIT